MSRERYIAALVLGAIILIIGFILAFTLPVFDGDEWLICILSYSVATAIINLVWFDGPIVVIGAYGFGAIGIVWRFIFHMFGSATEGSGCGIFMSLLVLAGLPIVVSVSAVIFFVLIVIVLVASALTFPIYVVKFGKDLD